METFKDICKSYFAINNRDIIVKEKEQKNYFVNYFGIFILLPIFILKLKKNDSLLILLTAFFSVLSDGVFFGSRKNYLVVIDRWFATLGYIVITKNFFRKNRKVYLKSSIYITHTLLSSFFLIKSKKSLSTKEYNKYHGLWHFYGIGIGNLIMFLFKDL